MHEGISAHKAIVNQGAEIMFGSIRDSPRSVVAERRWLALWVAGALLVAGSYVASLAVTTAGAQTGNVKATSARSSAPLSAASDFCAHFSASKVSSTIGGKVKLFEAVAKSSTSLECIFEGTEQVVISRDTGILASELSTRAKAEARIKAQSPKGVKITFVSLPSLGATAFSWTYEINGGQLLGVGDNSKTTAYGALIGGAPKLISAPGRTNVVVNLVKLDLAA
jgi:hypothetical protein